MYRHFWDHIFVTAETINEVQHDTDNILEQVSVYLESIEAIFDREFDPAKAYEEFVTLFLCKALSRALRDNLK